jgi:hypothetical protein
VWTAEAAAVLVAMGGVAAAVADLSTSRRRALLLAGSVVLVAAAETVFGAVQWSRGAATVLGTRSGSVTAPFGSFVNHNHFAGLAVMGAALASGLALGDARRHRAPTPVTLALAGIALAGVGAVFASGSRSGVLAALAAGGALALLWRATGRPGRPRPWWPLLAAAAVLLAFAWASSSPAIRDRLSAALRGDLQASGAYRWDLALATLRLAAAHPILGSGVGAYADAIPPFKRGLSTVESVHAESDALEVLAEAGLLGLGAIVVLGVVAARGLRRTLNDPLDRGLACGAGAAVIGLAAHSLFDFNLRVPSNALILAVCLGLAAGGTASSVRPRLAIVLGVLLLGVGTACTARAVVAYRLESARAVAEPRQRLARLNGVVRIWAWSPEAWRARAHTQMTLGRGPLPTPRILQARGDLERALALRPAWAAARAERGALLGWLGEGVEACADLRQALDQDPTSATLQRYASDVAGHLAAAGRPCALK